MPVNPIFEIIKDLKLSADAVTKKFRVSQNPVIGKESFGCALTLLPTNSKKMYNAVIAFFTVASIDF